LKIVIFEPHPDDLLFGPGPILLEWIKEKEHDIHIITVTDGRACYRSGDDVYSEDVAKMRTNEVKKSIEFLGLPHQNHHLFNFHDAEGQKYVKDDDRKLFNRIPSKFFTFHRERKWSKSNLRKSR